MHPLTSYTPDSAQRWRDRKASFVARGGFFDRREFEVASIPDDTTARAFVQQHHYSRSYPAARFRFGLYRRGALVGVCVYSVGMPQVLATAFPTLPTADAVELGRLVLLDEVGRNAESWFVNATFGWLRPAGVRGLLTMSDPVPRTTVTGEVIMPGHLGIVYRALNMRYGGRATARVWRLLPDGSVFNPRLMQKVRSGERGWQTAGELFAPYGLAPLPEDADRPARMAWLAAALRLTRPLKHGGNLKYGLRLDRGPAPFTAARYPTWTDLEAV